jgi:hypothetical protein
MAARAGKDVAATDAAPRVRMKERRDNPDENDMVKAPEIG